MSKAQKSLSLQLKRKQQTFIVTLNTSTPRYSDIKKQLYAIIEAVGGVTDPSYIPSQGDEDDDGDIPIPVPTYGGLDSDDDDEDDKEEEKKAQSKGQPAKGKLMPKIGELVIGYPKDLSDVYGSGFKDVLQEQEKVPLDTGSFSILAFRLEEEKFDVQEPKVYDDE